MSEDGIFIEKVVNKRSLRDFIDVPWNVYSDTDNWVPPLKIERKMAFSPSQGIFQHLNWSGWVAYENGVPVVDEDGDILEYTITGEDANAFLVTGNIISFCSRAIYPGSPACLNELPTKYSQKNEVELTFDPESGYKIFTRNVLDKAVYDINNDGFKDLLVWYSQNEVKEEYINEDGKYIGPDQLTSSILSQNEKRKIIAFNGSSSGYNFDMNATTTKILYEYNTIPGMEAYSFKILPKILFIKSILAVIPNKSPGVDSPNEKLHVDSLVPQKREK